MTPSTKTPSTKTPSTKTPSTKAPRLAVLGILFASACASPPVMRLVPVPVDPDTTLVEVYVHEAVVGALEFETVRAHRVGAADQVHIQLQARNTARMPCMGTYQVEFRDANQRRTSATGRVPFNVPDGGTFVIDAKATTRNAAAAVITVRPD